MERLNTKLRGLCVLGTVISVYATYVEINAEHNANYKALCDISPHISCTAVFNTSYGKGFGLLQHVFGADSILNQPNGVLGIIFYILLFLSTFIRAPWIALFQIIVSVVSNLMSIYLAYLLYFVLEIFCVVCASVYVVNFCCLLQTWHIFKEQWGTQPQTQQNEKSQKKQN